MARFLNMRDYFDLDNLDDVDNLDNILRKVYLIRANLLESLSDENLLEFMPAFSA